MLKKNWFNDLPKVEGSKDFTEKDFFELLTKDRHYDKDKEEHICCLCGDVFYGYGNNPAPLASSKKRCCNMCDITKVIPARARE